MSAYLDALLRYFDANGRTTRSQFWLYQLVYVALLVAAVCVDTLVLKRHYYDVGGHRIPLLVTMITAFFHAVPNVMICVRRLHDIGRSGTWFMVQFVPFGGFLLLWWYCCPSEQGENEYGRPFSRHRPDEPEGAQYARRPRSDDYVQQTLNRIEARRPQAERFI